MGRRTSRKFKGIYSSLVTMLSSLKKHSTEPKVTQILPANLSWGSPKNSKLPDFQTVDGDGDEEPPPGDDTLFFKEMERNIHRNMSLGLLAADVPEDPKRYRIDSLDSNAPRERARFTLDDTFVDDVVKKETILLNTKAQSERRVLLRDAISETPRKAPPVVVSLEKIEKQLTSPRTMALVHSNSTGSLHIDSTLSDPDFKATIECVCRALHAFLTRPINKNPPDAPKNRTPVTIFDDQNATESEESGVPPSLKELTKFMRSVYRRGEMHVECLVAAFIFIERLLKSYKGALSLKPTNWRPIVFSTMILASKICDDESPVNADWCYVCSSFTVKRINQLELALLTAYNFKPTVSASQYAKTYFHFRSMAARVGLIGTLQPLDIAVAKRISETSKLVAHPRPHRAASPDLTAHQLTPTKGPFDRRSNSFLGVRTSLLSYRPKAGIEHVVSDMSPSPTSSSSAGRSGSLLSHQKRSSNGGSRRHFFASLTGLDR